MSNFAKTLERGLSILILRQDGRRHPAIISEIDNTKQTVTVEWYENCETKGKEIEFINVYALNPDLKPGGLRSFEDIAHSLSKNDHLSRNSIKQFTMTPQPINKTIKHSNRLTNSATKSVPIYEKNENITQQGNIFSSNSSTINKNIVSRMSLIPPPSFSDINIVKRHARASVVIEVEKLQKNREERRQRQAEAREEQRALMNIYPKNPHWKYAKMITDYQKTIEFNPLIGTETFESRQITVCVRKRPLNKKEITKNEIDVITVPKKNLIIVHEPKNKVDLTKYLDNQHFYFDYVFDDNCSNEIVYKFTAKPLIETIFEGGMATCFAYGQTGSGKTHTMGGNFSRKKQDLQKGIYIMAAKDVFEFLNSPLYQNQNFIVSSTFFEIYQGKVFDLLAKKARLKVLEDGKQQVQIIGLTEKVVTTLDGVLSLLQIGNISRASGKTTANSNSSRSHAVFQIILRIPGIQKIHGKFSLIDLAGNERGADTSSANRITQMEGAEINKSLLALKECIRALGRKVGGHLPFRQSKLTQVLRDSFVGEKSKTCMIAMISPGMSSCEHTLNTLRYADRVKELVPNDIEDEKYINMDESNDLFNVQPLWNIEKESILNENFELDTECLQVNDDDLLMAVRFEENISHPFGEITNNQDSTLSNILNQIPQQI